MQELSVVAGEARGEQTLQPWEVKAYIKAHWPEFIIGPDMPVVARGEVHPVSCGVYFLFAEDDGLQYVGSSKQLPKRLRHHKCLGRQYATYGVLPVREEVMKAIEAAYIDALNPPENILRSTAYVCRPHHEALKKDILAAWSQVQSGMFRMEG